MFRLKKTADQKVAISIARRTVTPRKILISALICSLVLHFSVFIFFRVKQTYPTVVHSAPTPSVFTEFDEISTPFFDSSQTLEHPFHKILDEFHIVDPTPQSSPLVSLPAIGDDLPSLPAIACLPWTSDDLAASHHTVRVYPLKIILHHSLRHLRLTDDASSCFKKATNDTLFTSSDFSETHPKVEFLVDICPKTGKIEQAICHKELVDKRLQDLAEFILRQICFAPVNDNAKISGRLSLQFAGTFDSLSLLLEKEVL
jgi:hypothetical protein